jgi:hypothetical protein
LSASSIRAFLVRLLIFAVASGFTGVFFIIWCDWIYQCGCTFLWAGAAAQCNIHIAGVAHCPWCTSETFGGVAFVGVLLSQAAVVFWPGRAGWLRLLAALAASPLSAGVIGAAIGWGSGYWN